MPIRWTSRLAVAELVDELAGRRLEVYSAIRAWDPVEQGPGPSIEDLAKVTGRKESTVCARIDELRKHGLIAEGPLKTNSTGKQAMTYIALAWCEQPPQQFRVDRTGQTCFF